VALAVCLLFDDTSARPLQRLWRRLEEEGVPTLLSHTHGRHVPHLSLAVLRSFDVTAVRRTVEQLPHAGPTPLHLDALGLFRRGRSWLVPAVTADLVHRQERLVTALLDTGAELHRHYAPGVWVPHITIAPRVRLEALTALAAAVYEVVPLDLVADRAALIDSGTGEHWPLATLP